jgi:hypothetical protein
MPGAGVPDWIEPNDRITSQNNNAVRLGKVFLGYKNLTLDYLIGAPHCGQCVQSASNPAPQ